MARNALMRFSWHLWRSCSDVTLVACASELGFVAGSSGLLFRNELLNSEIPWDMGASLGVWTAAILAHAHPHRNEALSRMGGFL